MLFCSILTSVENSKYAIYMKVIRIFVEKTVILLILIFILIIRQKITSHIRQYLVFTFDNNMCQTPMFFTFSAWVTLPRSMTRPSSLLASGTRSDLRATWVSEGRCQVVYPLSHTFCRNIVTLNKSYCMVKLSNQDNIRDKGYRI